MDVDCRRCAGGHVVTGVGGNAGLKVQSQDFLARLFFISDLIFFFVLLAQGASLLLFIEHYQDHHKTPLSAKNQNVVPICSKAAQFLPRMLKFEPLSEKTVSLAPS